MRQTILRKRLSNKVEILERCNAFRNVENSVSRFDRKIRKRPRAPRLAIVHTQFRRLGARQAIARTGTPDHLRACSKERWSLLIGRSRTWLCDSSLRLFAHWLGGLTSSPQTRLIANADRARCRPYNAIHVGTRMVICMGGGRISAPVDLCVRIYYRNLTQRENPPASTPPMSGSGPSFATQSSYANWCIRFSYQHHREATHPRRISE